MEQVVANLEKAFDAWNQRKKHIHIKFRRKYPKRGEVWICNLGLNIGSEQNGIRPCLVLNNPVPKERTCVVVPASSTRRQHTITIHGYHFLMHQVRTVDTKRLVRHIMRLEKEAVDKLQTELQQFLGK